MRLTDNDRRFGPIVFGKTDWNPWRVVYSSGGCDEGDKGNSGNFLTVSLFRWVFRIPMPKLIKPFRVRHIAKTWDEATIKKMGRNWYDEFFEREYGFSLNEGFLQIFLGAQTHDSLTTQDWCKHLPWMDWRFISHKLYDANGNFHAEIANIGFGHGEYEKRTELVESCTKRVFALKDFDGTDIEATTKIEQRQWRLGTGWFKWLGFLRTKKTSRSLDISFNKEVGPEKGSWKGGTLGHGIEMLPTETHEQAMRRYCEQDLRSKYRNYKIEFIRELTQ